MLHAEEIMDARPEAGQNLCPSHDPAILREQAYADGTHLNVRRRTHQLYTVDPVDFGQWTLEQIPWRGDERILDVGCFDMTKVAGAIVGRKEG